MSRSHRFSRTRDALALVVILAATASPGAAATPTAAAPTVHVALPSPLDPGIWKARAPTGLARQEVSYVEVAGTFYLAWGSTVQQAYDPSSNTWSDVHQLPAALNHIQGVEVGGKIYYLGGLTLTRPPTSVGTVYIYDPATDSFSTGASMPSGRERGAGGVGVFDGKIYYAGGWHNGVSVDWFDEYDPVADEWTALPAMPHARDHAYAAVVGDRMYMIGGRVSGTPIPENDAFDFTQEAWVTGLAPIPTLRGGYAIGAIGNELFVIGGEAGTSVYGAVEAYDTAQDSWRTLASMPTPRHGIQAVVWQGGIYVAAGGAHSGGKAPTDVHEVLFPTSARPDAMVRLAGDPSYLGVNAYEDPPGATRSTQGVIGQPISFQIRVQNDAAVSDRILVKGPGGSPSFDVTYFLGGNDVTASVTGAGFLLPKLAPGKTRTLTLQVDPTASASGASGSWTIATASRRVAAIDDHVTAAVSVP